MKKYKTLFLSAALATLASCHTNRSPLTYFMDIDKVEQAVPTGDYKVKIEPSDELFITVTSSIPEATALYNLPLANPATNALLNTYQSAQQQTYIVDSKGCINFPLLGRIYVEGMTVEQLQTKLTEEIGKDVEDPHVRVELMNFKVSIAGEVARPGTVTVRNQRFSVLEALSAAGDLTPYAERNNVLVIREQDGKRSYGRINLNSADALQSPYFYLKQNDYIYVEPNEIRKDNSEYNQNNSFKLSVISTIVSASSVIASLVIALAVK